MSVNEVQRFFWNPDVDRRIRSNTIYCFRLEAPACANVELLKTVNIETSSSDTEVACERQGIIAIIRSSCPYILPPVSVFDR